ncbi:hypothetical protein JYK22_21320, partial [Nonomuraea sp. RK-328]|nr:hypothetical protein [Nonomuraea sp. RK-328]
MNTTAAAAQAQVTIATIRTWCRSGAVAASKVAGRWIIEAASLARRISLSARRRPMSIEHQIDATTVIRVEPAEKRPNIYIATEYRNGYRIGAVGDGHTAEEALATALNVLAARDEHLAAEAALTQAGIYADMTGRRGGIH